MSTSTELEDVINSVISGNEDYNSFEGRWKYYYQSYLGGEDYRRAGHLVRYQNETDAEYAARVKATPLENHCQSVISVYNSFLFREDPERDLGTLENLPEAADFLRDADLDGRSLDHFMADANVWASVFGHCWVVMAKPNVGAVSAAQERAMGVRPYVNMLTPLAVLDWEYTRNFVGRYELSYLRYIEDINGDVVTVKEWFPEAVRTKIVDKGKRTINNEFVEDNQLGKVPAVCVYNQRTGYRGIGKSDISDVADLQRFIYNATSEVDQSIRLNTHPSLVKTSDTNAGIGAGSVIEIDDAMDPALKPYLLEFSGASVESIYTAIEHAVQAIEKMSNIGAVRATDSKVMSGVAMDTEFQLLNSKLAGKANAMQLAEEQIWRLFAMYQAREWTGNIEYPGSFNIRDTKMEIEQLKIAKETATDDLVLREIDKQILAWMELDKTLEELRAEAFMPHPMYDPVTGDVQMANTYEQHLELSAQGWTHTAPQTNQGEL